MKKRVHCEDCFNFIPAEFEDNNNLVSKIKKNAKCKLGHSVMFRMPKFANPSCYVSLNDYGYIRYCSDFKENK